MEHGQIDGNAPRDHDDRATLDDDHQKCTKVILKTRRSSISICMSFQISQTFGEIDDFDGEEVSDDNDERRKGIADEDSNDVTIETEADGIYEVICLNPERILQGNGC